MEKNSMQWKVENVNPSFPKVKVASRFAKIEQGVFSLVERMTWWQSNNNDNNYSIINRIWVSDSFAFTQVMNDPMRHRTEDHY